jgi:LysR family transcriptional regulator, nitrogen assimilation regulatory protein
VINPVSDDRVFCRDLLAEDLAVIGGLESGLRPDRPVSFTELAGLPLVLPASPAGIRGTVESSALRLRLRIQCRYSTDSVEVAKDLIAAGLVHGVLPISACGPEIEDGRLRCAPLREPTLPHRLCIAASSRLDLPRELAVRIGEILREETGLLISSGTWPAVFLAPHRWDPNRA